MPTVKPQHFAALAGFLLLVAVILMMTGLPADRSGGEEAKTAARVLTVTGEGEVKVKPDTVLITFGVTAHKPSAVDAELTALQAMEQIRDAVAKSGADQERTELSAVTLAPDTYQDFAGVVRISGFQARGTVQAVVRPAGRAQEVLDGGLGAGATAVDSVLYTLSDAETAKQAAMKAALENARERAGTMTRAEGERLGALRSMEVLLEESQGTALSPGGLVFRAKVRATFEY